MKGIILKMEILERAIGQLYRIYAEIFTADTLSWDQLSKEEEYHLK